MSATDHTPDTIVTTRPKYQQETRTRRVPPYNVVLENDDHHSFEFVVDVLCKSLGVSKERSYQLTLEAHHGGQAIVWTGPKEIAELKVDQIRTFHENHMVSGQPLGPLGCHIEPAPGG